MFRSEVVAQDSALDHTGEPSSFSPVVAAPREIGELRSCSVDIGSEGVSDARRASLRSARAGRIWFTGVGGIVALLFGKLAAGWPVGAAVGVLVALACYGLSASFVRGALTTFVAEKGVARLRHGARAGLEVLSFAEVEALLVAREARGTSMAFSFVFRRAGKPAFRILGSYPLSQSGEPYAFGDHPIWFALAAERAYVEYRLPRVLQTLADGGECRFAVSKREAITLTADGIKLEPASGGVYGCRWLLARLPLVDREMLEFHASKGMVAGGPALANPFAAPGKESETEKVIFRGSELPDVALLLAVIEAKTTGERRALLSDAL
jgi:hypothetical protein